MMSIHPQEVRALLGRQPGAHPVNDEQLLRIVAVLNDARSELSPEAPAGEEADPEPERP